MKTVKTIINQTFKIVFKEATLITRNCKTLVMYHVMIFNILIFFNYRRVSLRRNETLILWITFIVN